MADYWIKLYIEILDDPKMATIPDRLWRRTIELYLLAGRVNKGGQLPPSNQIAWALRSTTDEIEFDLAQLSVAKLIEKNRDGWFIPNFAKRQAAASSTERSRYFRKKEKENLYYDNQKYTKGIYRISCTKNDKVYIGSSVHCEKRIKEHFYGGKTFEDHWMYDDFQKYGSKEFVSEIVEIVQNDSDLPERETYWLNKYKKGDLYNSESIGKQHRDRNATVMQRKVAQNRLTDTETETEQNRTDNNAEVAVLSDFGKVYDIYSNNIGVLSPIIADKLQADIDDYSVDWVIDAIKEAARQEKRSLAYAEGILKRWKRDGKSNGQVKGMNGSYYPEPKYQPSPEQIARELEGIHD